MELPSAVEREYQEAFQLFDKDGDKQITPSEFETIITKMEAPNSKKLAAQMWKDSGAGGTMSYDQFKKAFLGTFIIENKRAEIMDAFEVFDYEKKGKIHEVEIKLIFSQMGNQLDSTEIAELVKHLGPDKDGMCDYRELVKKMFTACQEKA